VDGDIVLNLNIFIFNFFLYRAFFFEIAVYIIISKTHARVLFEL